MKRNRLFTTGLACLTLLVVLQPVHAQRRGGFGVGQGYGNFGGHSGFGNYGFGNYGFGNYGSGVFNGYQGGSWGSFPSGSSYGYGYGYNPNLSGSWGTNLGGGQMPYLNSQLYPGYNVATPSYNYGTPSTGYATSGYYGTPGYNYGTPSYGYAAPGIATAAAGQATGSTGNAQQSFYAGPSPRDPNAAAIRVDVPNPGAKVWVEGKETQQQGTQRVFHSPPLEKGYNYTYHVRAAWDENGKQVEREKNVQVRAGQESTVSFAGSQGFDGASRGSSQARPDNDQNPTDSQRPRPAQNPSKDPQRDQSPDR